MFPSVGGVGNIENRNRGRPSGSSSLTLLELVPRRSISSGRYIRRIKYSRIDVNLFTKYAIKKLFEERRTKDIPVIIETDDYFIIQHRDNPAFFLSKEKGRLFYNPTLTPDVEHLERQASIFLEIIRKIVVGFRMVNIETKLKFIGEEHYGEKKR